MSSPWTAEIARAKAAVHKRPVVTRVDAGMWVMYPPLASQMVRGGYPAETAETAQQITERIAIRVWGVKPLIVDKQLVTPPKGGAK
jgi:butyrate kinase